MKREVSALPSERPALAGGRSVLALLICLSASFAAAVVGGLLTGSSVSTWYPALRKPSWTPSAGWFGPVWTTLYVLMAIAAWRVWLRHGIRGARSALAVHALQLGLNAAWSGLFFGLRAPALAFAEILVLWLAVAATVLLFAARDRVAALLLAPYLAWVSFAAVLNGSIAWMNRP